MKSPFSDSVKFICLKNDGLMTASFDNKKIIVQREPVFACIAMAEDGLATAQIAENSLAILKFNTE